MGAKHVDFNALENQDVDAAAEASGLMMLLDSLDLPVRKLRGHALELGRLGVAEYNKHWTRNKDLQYRLGMPEWDEWSDSTVVLTLDVYADQHDISGVDGLEEGIVFVHRFFSFANHPMSAEAITKRVPILRRRILMFEHFMQCPGVRFHAASGKVTVGGEYNSIMAKEPFVYKYFCTCGLKEYDAHISVFKERKAARLPKERRITGNPTNGLGFTLDDEFFI